MNLNEVRQNPRLVKAWALELLDRIGVPSDDARGGISHPTISEAALLAVAISGIETPWLLTLSVTPSGREEDRANEARQTAMEIYRLIPIGPQWVGYAETINALAESSASLADWAEAKSLRHQLAEAAGQTLEEAGKVALFAGISIPTIIVGIIVLRLLSTQPRR